MNLPFEETEVAKSFGKAAMSYDQVAVFQREVGKRLLERLDFMRIKPAKILDLGAGTGFCSKQLEIRFRQANVYSFDLAYPLLQIAKSGAPWYGNQLLVCGNALKLPFASQSFDLIISNLMLHWCFDLQSVFNEIRRVLSPNGLFLFSSLGPDTLYELRQSWRAVDHYPHVNEFIDMHDVGDRLLASQLSDPVMDMEKIILTYPQVKNLMRDLKQLGAHNLSSNRFRGLTGRSKFKKVIEYYERFQLENGTYPATYEVLYGHAWQSELSGYGLNENNEAFIPLKSLRRVIR